MQKFVIIIEKMFFCGKSQVLLAFSKNDFYLCTKKENMLTSLNIESLVRSILDMSTVVAEDYREYLPVRTHALAWATGMTDKEVLD